MRAIGAIDGPSEPRPAPASALAGAAANGSAPTRCRVCGCEEVVTDDVIDASWLWLAECPRCDHRWTATVAPPVQRVRARRPARRREGVAAA